MGNNQESFDKFRYQRSCFFYRRICSAVLKDPGIVRNKGKIKAILENAQNFIAIEKRYSSFQKYLDGLNKSDNYANATKDLINKFKWMGAPSESLFLYTVGEK